MLDSTPRPAPNHPNPLRDRRDRRLEKIAGPSALVFFGITGDLARKKLMPAVYDLANRGLLPPNFAVLGFGRRDWDAGEFAAEAKAWVKDHARTAFNETVWEQLASGFRFISGGFDDDAAFIKLRETLDDLAKSRGTSKNHAFYLSIPPNSFETVCQQLSKHGLAHDDSPDAGWSRVVIEKPFGHDLASARELNEIVESVFPPDAVFRIDHYLGKETVQNLLAGARRHPEPPAAAAGAHRHGRTDLLRRGPPAQRKGKGAHRRAAARGP